MRKFILDLVELESELELSEPRGENIFSLFIVTDLIHIIISVRYMVLIGIGFMLKTKPGKPTTQGRIQDFLTGTGRG